LKPALPSRRASPICIGVGRLLERLLLGRIARVTLTSAHLFKHVERGTARAGSADGRTTSGWYEVVAGDLVILAE
jgi:hypothetical protein